MWNVLALVATEVGGGILFGGAVGWVVYHMLSRVDNYPVEILLTLAIVTGGYALAQVLHISGPLAMVIILTSFYMVMPVGHISIRHALIGGITATILWEIMRRNLVWYYSTLSLVNVIYGSLTTVVITLLMIEIAVIILLLGAQVIAEFDRGKIDAAK